jgi:hypothetical protein
MAGSTSRQLARAALQQLDLLGRETAARSRRRAALEELAVEAQHGVRRAPGQSRPSIVAQSERSISASVAARAPVFAGR